MNPGQKMFYDFFISHTSPENMEQAKAILLDNFKRQDEKTFTLEYFLEIEGEMLALVKQESLEAVKVAMADFKSRL